MNTTANQAAATPRVILITGGSRGLGRSMALALAARGADVIITYRQAEAQANDVVENIRATGQRAVALQLDVGDSRNFPSFAIRVKAALSETFGQTELTALVNNAGEGLDHAGIEQTTEAQFDLMMNVHLKAPFFLTQALLPMIADGGHILNVSSGLARFTFPGFAAYATMKGGVEVLTRYMAKEFAGRRISVNTLAPGAIATDFGGGRLRDDANLAAMVSSTIAMGRMGQPDDIGHAVAALLEPGTHWMTGQRIEVSGGQML